MEQARRFFALPFEEKMEIAIARSTCHSGYVPPKTEALDPTVGADGKEALDITTDRAADHPEVMAGTPLHGPAQWPASLMPDFKSVADEYAKACLDINAHLMRGLALALGLDADASCRCSPTRSGRSVCCTTHPFLSAIPHSASRPTPTTAR